MRVRAVRTSPVLLEVVLTLEGLATSLAREGDVILVRPLVDHEVVGLGEAALTVLADELTLSPHLAPEFATVVRLNGHYGEHRRGVKWRHAGRYTHAREHCSSWIAQLCRLKHVRSLPVHSERKIIPPPQMRESNPGQHAPRYTTRGPHFP